MIRFIFSSLKLPLKYLSLYLAFLACFLNLQVARSEPFSFPELDTDEKRLQWLLSVKENIPGVFAEAANYDIDLMHLLEDQDKLQKLLSKKPEYLKAMQAQHSSWLSVAISPKNEQVIKTFRIKPEALEGWKKNLKQTLDSIPADKPLPEELLKEISAQSEWLNGRSSLGLETGLVMSLLPEERKAILSASAEEKLRLLETKLPQNIGSNFKASLYGLENGPSKTEALELIKTIRAGEQKLRDLTELSLVLQNSEGKIESASVARIETLRVNDLEFFNNADALGSKLQKFGVEVSKQHGHGLNKGITLSIEKHAKTFSSQLEAVEEKLGQGIKLVEMPPAMGIFRGCTGGDCSTQLSFPYPNAPNERVFYVYDPEGQLKGYVTGSLVEAKGRPSFQVITIAGPRISSADTEMILEGLSRIKKELQVEQLVLPSKEQIKSMLNFVPIRSVYEKAVEGKSLVEIKYLDQTHRARIEGFSSQYNKGAYDKMAKNTKAIIYKERENFPLAVEVSKEFHEIKHLPQSSVQHAAFEFVMDLIENKREKQVSRILSAAQIPVKQHTAILDTLMNTKGLSISDYQAKLKTMLGYSDAELSLKMSTFMPGYFKASDFSTMESDPRFRDYVIKQYIKEFKENPSKVSEKMMSNQLIKSLIEKDDPLIMQNLAKYIFSKPLTEKMEDLLKQLIEKGDPTTLQNLAFETFSKPHTANMQDALKQLIEKGNQALLQNLAQYTFSQPHTANMQDLLKLLIEKADSATQLQIAKYVFSKPHTANMQDALIQLIKKKDPATMQYLSYEILSMPHMTNMQEAIKLLIQEGDSATLQNLGRYLFSKPHTANMEDELKLLIEKGDDKTRQFLAFETFSKPHTAKMKDAIKLLIEKGDETTLNYLSQYAFSRPHWDLPENATLKGALQIKDPSTRQVFLNKASRCPTLFKSLVKSSK